MDTAALCAHQRVLLELLKEFDAICQKHQIQYMLFAGSALGAVRHRGFIPWDDDLDIIMTRGEYDRFLAVADTELNADLYVLQREFSMHWPMFFSKLRKNNTACMERFIPRDRQMHQGIYIDIFPCDNLSDNPLAAKLQFLASKIVIAKALDKRGYLTDSKIKKLFIFLCRGLPTGALHRFACGAHLHNTNRVHSFFGASSKYQKSIYPRAWVTDIIQMPFEDGEYPVSAQYDALLTRLYGAYMIPHTPEERKCKVHAELVDTEHSYTEYLDWQMNQAFDVYTRSIR